MNTTRTIGAAALAATLILGSASAADAAPVAKRHTVTLVAVMSEPATVTSAGNHVIEQKERSGSWARTFTKKAYGYYSVDVSIWASDDDNAKVQCEILVDGKVKRHKVATGNFADVDCTL